MRAWLTVFAKFQASDLPADFAHFDFFEEAIINFIMAEQEWVRRDAASGRVDWTEPADIITKGRGDNTLLVQPVGDEPLRVSSLCLDITSSRAVRGPGEEIQHAQIAGL